MNLKLVAAAGSLALAGAFTSVTYAQVAPSTQAFMDANAAMHAAMMITYSGNSDVDFVHGMVPHHQGAVAMAMIELEYGTAPELRMLAETIIAAQEAEIGQMQAWIEMNAPSAPAAEHAGHEGAPTDPAPAASEHAGMDMTGPMGDQGESSHAFFDANARMHEAMDVGFTGNADVDFARSMIPHHQGAIDMAMIELEYGSDHDLHALAEMIIAAQQEEITALQSWLAENAP